MSTVILNFEKREFVAENRDAAVKMIEKELFHVNGDATQAYKNWKEKQTSVTDRDLKEFMLDYLASKGKNCPGAGYTITLEGAVKDTRERPYTIANIKNEDGVRKPVRVFNIVNIATGVTEAKVNTNKAEAISVMKDLIVKNHADYEIVKAWEVKNEKQRVVARGCYTPSKGTKKGIYLAFGIKAN